MRKHISKKTRDKIKQKFGGRCAYCGEEGKLQIDHVVPVCRSHQIYNHGIADIDSENNLMPACFSCNNYKLNRSLEEFRSDLEAQVWRARRTSLNFRLAERYGQIKETKSPIVFYFERAQA